MAKRVEVMRRIFFEEDEEMQGMPASSAMREFSAGLHDTGGKNL